MSDKTNFELVGEFMETFGQEVKTKPELPSNEVMALRCDLIDEELKELLSAIYKDEEPNMTAIADALTDILYVTYGAGHAFGIDLDACFKEVQRSNMSKLDKNGQPIYREDGKILKGPNFSEPNLEQFVS